VTSAAAWSLSPVRTVKALAAMVRSGLTQAELGNRTGYSAAQVSRYERRVTPLTNVTVLRRFVGS
jgi:transcriptional regulator with XRE-family HTH domain